MEKTNTAVPQKSKLEFDGIIQTAKLLVLNELVMRLLVADADQRAIDIVKQLAEDVKAGL